MLSVSKFRVGEALYFDYPSEKVGLQIRHVLPLGFAFNHDTKNWLLETFDLDKKEYRSFIFSKIQLLEVKDEGN